MSAFIGSSCTPRRAASSLETTRGLSRIHARISRVHGPVGRASRRARRRPISASSAASGMPLAQGCSRVFPGPGHVDPVDVLSTFAASGVRLAVPRREALAQGIGILHPSGSRGPVGDPVQVLDPHDPGEGDHACRRQLHAADLDPWGIPAAVQRPHATVPDSFGDRLGDQHTVMVPERLFGAHGVDHLMGPDPPHVRGAGMTVGEADAHLVAGALSRRPGARPIARSRAPRR